MGAFIPKVQSPITGEPVSTVSNGFFFPSSPENISKWKQWWKLINREQSVTFLLIGSVGLCLLMLLAHASLIGKNLPIGMGLIQEEGRVVSGALGKTWLVIFNLMVFSVFFTTALGVLDHVARVSADILKSHVGVLRRSKAAAASESALYFYVLWAMILFAVFILLAAKITSTPLLLSTAGALSGVVMFLYSVLILVLNIRLRREVDQMDAGFGGDNPFRISRWRLCMLVLAILFFGSLSLLIVSEAIKAL
jgi:hypothetical protein